MNTSSQESDAIAGEEFALGQLRSLVCWIDDKLKGVDVDLTRKYRMAASCCYQTLEHQHAIASLLGNKLDGSAFALLRVMTESCIRGWWLMLCATDADVEYFQEHDGPPHGLNKLVDEIARYAPVDNVFQKILVNQWGTLCSFTHTGYLQISQRMSSPILKSNVQMRLMAISYTRNIGLLAAVGIAELSGNDALATLFEKAVRGAYN